MRKRSLALTGVLNLVGQGVLLALLYGVSSDRPLAVAPGWRDLILASLAMGQSAIWVVFFYLQDRTEPEPTSYALAAFGAGMAAAALLALPFEQTIFDLRDWMFQSRTNLVLGATCVRGALASLIVYAFIRFGFQPSPEFDEPADGMAYGAFIGCGLAAVTSLAYLAAHPDFTLFAAAVAVATNVLVYASVGALVGYLVGAAKFSAQPSRFKSATAILLGSALIGGYQVIVEYAIVAGADHGLWAGAGAAMVLALIILGFATILMNRLTARAEPPQGYAIRRLDLSAIVVGVALLAIGANAAHRSLQPVVFHDAKYAIAFRYDPIVAIPAMRSGAGGVTQAAFTDSGTSNLPIVFTARTRDGATITVQARAGALSLDQFLPEPFLRATEPIGLTVTEVSVGGHRGMRLHYAYQQYPEGPSIELPRLRWAYTDVVPVGSRTYAISFEAEPGGFTAGEAFYQQLLSSVTWSGE